MVLPETMKRFDDKVSDFLTRGLFFGGWTFDIGEFILGRLSLNFIFAKMCVSAFKFRILCLERDGLQFLALGGPAGGVYFC